MATTAPTGAQLLEAIRIDSDALAVDAQGCLAIAGVDAASLVAAHGSPLFVTVERTLRANYRRIRGAFAQRWPQPVNVMYSIKANNALAIRALLSREGAGGDCFGLGELNATLAAGTEPARVVMNGSNKTPQEIDEAVARGITINVDSHDEIAFLRDACARHSRRARVNLRLKVLPADLDRHVAASSPAGGSYVARLERVKWGYVAASARPLVDALRTTPGVDLAGYSCHVGHLSKAPEAMAAVARAFGAAAAELARATGFQPTILDLGGGWAPQRDPSFRDGGRTPFAIEAYVEAATSALRGALPHDMPVPELWVEPGRYIVSNAVVLLATVGAVKVDAGHRWVHVDASTNLLPRIESGNFHYTILPGGRMHEAADAPADVVGSTCFRSVLGAQRALPPLRRGDIVAILDSGMYAEVFSNQFNGVPRPGGVLLSDHGVDVIRERETISDVFARQRMPEWLAPRATAGVRAFVG